MTEFCYLLEDTRCDWSPIPVYLDAAFYSKSSGPFSTRDVHAAYRFPSRKTAEAFAVKHNLLLFISVEHGFMKASPLASAATDMAPTTTSIPDGTGTGGSSEKHSGGAK